MSGDELEVIGRIAIGALLGYVVGWEREYRGSTAGDRTFALVALGAAAFTALGVENFPETAEKVLAGIVTGVGFLGAGLIMKGNGNEVVGLTTAASLWATASLGVLAGADEVGIALGITALVLLVLEYPNLPALGRIDAARMRDRQKERDLAES